RDPEVGAGDGDGRVGADETRREVAAVGGGALVLPARLMRVAVVAARTTSPRTEEAHHRDAGDRAAKRARAPGSLPPPRQPPEHADGAEGEQPERAGGALLAARARVRAPRSRDLHRAAADQRLLGGSDVPFLVLGLDTQRRGIADVHLLQRADGFPFRPVAA